MTGVTSSTNLIPAVPQTISYNSFGKVSSISEANGSQTINATFIYNSDNQRAKMTVGIYYGAEILTRYYVGGSYMKEVQPNTTNEYTYLGGDAYTAPVVVQNARGVISYYYLLRDYLGNITHQVNTSNTVVAEYSFDAWGRRRNATNWTYTLDANDKALFADRGFTSHEYLPWFNLVNMNGRLYDPLVERFLNADNYVQDPTATQNYNRYSYCLNNPLKYFDPSGNLHISNVTDNPVLDYIDSQNGYFDSNGYNSPGGGGSTGGGSSNEDFWNKVLDSVKNCKDGLTPITRGERKGVDGFWVQTENIEGDFTGWINKVNSPNLSINVINKFIAYNTTSQEIGWEFYVGTIISITEKSLFSNEFETWMGKDVRIRSQLWAGNGATGGKYGFAKSTSEKVGALGKILSAYSMYPSYNDWHNGDIDNAIFGGDMFSGLVGIFGGKYGASWSFGWELGKDYGAPKPQESVILEYLKTHKTGY